MKHILTALPLITLLGCGQFEQPQQNTTKSDDKSTALAFESSSELYNKLISKESKYLQMQLKPVDLTSVIYDFFGVEKGVKRSANFNFSTRKANVRIASYQVNTDGGGPKLLGIKNLTSEYGNLSIIVSETQFRDEPIEKELGLVSSYPYGVGKEFEISNKNQVNGAVSPFNDSIKAEMDKYFDEDFFAKPLKAQWQRLFDEGSFYSKDWEFLNDTVRIFSTSNEITMLKYSAGNENFKFLSFVKDPTTQKINSLYLERRVSKGNNGMLYHKIYERTFQVDKIIVKIDGKEQIVNFDTPEYAVESTQSNENDKFGLTEREYNKLGNLFTRDFPLSGRLEDLDLDKTYSILVRTNTSYSIDKIKSWGIDSLQPQTVLGNIFTAFANTKAVLELTKREEVIRLENSRSGGIPESRIGVGN